MKEIIRANVIAYIASFANIPTDGIKEEYVLKNDPLKLDDVKLAFLTIALRAYLKSLNPNETVLVTEIRKKDLDVKKTIELIITKSKA
ncbi:hypothetical protein [Pinibacter soli]|uniref:Uncharacterized protein n=1 Tax=Pinibacter soli TaxID=3044211 RepID=A0ABT6RHE4_9BACT|nr:hypothetical protein [Pinibacter soli]MDI3321997.1 hypothetical protein [Pinibacter soli]